MKKEEESGTTGVQTVLTPPSANPHDVETEAPPAYAFSHLRHELRTPLNQIIGFSDLLLEDAQAKGDAALARDLHKIRAAGKHLLQLMNDILDLAKVGTRRAPSPTGETALSAAELSAPPPTAPPQPWDIALASVLVVDDEETNRELLCRRLERHGYAVTVAAGGEEALRKLAEASFDLVLLDILMPGMTGFEVLARMKSDETLKHIPVVVISALDDLDSVVKCIEMGAEDYLPKPFNPVLLQARITASVEKKRLRDREHRLYDELQTNYRKLQELERLRDDLVHMIVHDLRQPLTSFLVGVRSVAEMGSLNNDQRECLGMAAAGGEMLIGMVNDLLDIGKMETGALTLLHQPVNVSALVEGAISQIIWLAKDKGLAVERNVAPGVVTVYGDEEKLRRTLVNLLGNAVKFTPPGGTITVASQRDDDGVVFSVRDTGEGIPEEAFNRIFEKFGTVEMRKGGQMMSTGLGLTFCRMVAEAHGGRAWVESRVGEGSTFFVAFPEDVA